MTFDERLDRLTERHEALIQSIKLAHHKRPEESGQLTRNFEIVLDSIKRLEHIAAIHE